MQAPLNRKLYTIYVVNLVFGIYLSLRPGHRETPSRHAKPLRAPLGARPHYIDAL